jgi:hypothetical protein
MKAEQFLKHYACLNSTPLAYDYWRIHVLCQEIAVVVTLLLSLDPVVLREDDQKAHQGHSDGDFLCCLQAPLEPWSLLVQL